MFDIKKVSEYFISNSVYCFTSDLDWASERDIQGAVNVFDELELLLTIFVTHHSEVVNKTYSNHRTHVGLHPNFKPSSIYGVSRAQQLDYCQALWPDARYLRAHSFYDESWLSLEMVKRGFEYDSNLCLFLQPYCMPLKHCSGLVRFPVFWEDDIHSMRGIDFQLIEILKFLGSPGLKIFNFHPTNLFSSNVMRKNITFLKELAEYIHRNSCNVMYLDDLYSFLAVM